MSEYYKRNEIPQIEYCSVYIWSIQQSEYVNCIIKMCLLFIKRQEGFSCLSVHIISYSSKNRGHKTLTKKILLLSLLLLFFLPSCAENTRQPCRDVLEAILKTEKEIPAGKIYDLRAETGDDEYLPERLIGSLFGDGEVPPARDGWLDAALFLPTHSHPHEIAVILCDSPDNATDTARLLLGHLDVLRAANSNGEYSEYFDSASVTVTGNYVLLIVSLDPESAIKAVSSMTRR